MIHKSRKRRKWMPGSSVISSLTLQHKVVSRTGAKTPKISLSMVSYSLLVLVFGGLAVVQHLVDSCFIVGETTSFV